MTYSEIKKLLPILHANNVLSLKQTKDGLELLFKESKPETITVHTKDGKTVTATQTPKPIETIKSTEAPLPTDSLEQEQGMSFDQVLNWSTGSDEFGVPGAQDNPLNDTPIEDPKINGGIAH